MSKISIKKDFKNGDKLYDVDLNNNFRVIEAGVNANEENLEQVIEDAEERLTNVFETESAATEARIRADNDETVQEIKDDNDETVEEIRQLTINEGWNWGGSTTDKVRFFKGNTSAVDSQPVQNGKLLFDEESGMIKLDDNNSRILLGGATWDETPKKPVKYKRKTTTQIASLPIEDGSVIYNTDNGKQFMDVGNQRIQTGGAGGEVILEDETITEDTKLIIEDEDLDFQPEEIVNEESNSTQKGYSASYTNARNTYSTDEVFTGKYWIDGKPLYRKVYKVENHENSYGIARPSNVDTFTKLSVMQKDSSNAWIPAYYLTSSDYLTIFAKDDYIKIRTSKANNTFIHYIIIEYTKESE